MRAGFLTLATACWRRKREFTTAMFLLWPSVRGPITWLASPCVHSWERQKKEGRKKNKNNIKHHSQRLEQIIKESTSKARRLQAPTNFPRCPSVRLRSEALCSVVAQRSACWDTGVTMELRQQKQLALWVGGRATGRQKRRRICPAQWHTTGTNKRKLVSVTSEPPHANTYSCRTAASWHKQTATTDKTTQSRSCKKTAQPPRHHTSHQRWGAGEIKLGRKKKNSHVVCEEKPHRIVAAGVPWQQSKNGKATVN